MSRGTAVERLDIMKYHVNLDVSADLVFTIDVQDGDEAAAARQAWDVFQCQFLNLDLGSTVVANIQASRASVFDEDYDNEWSIDSETIEEG